MKLAVPGEQKRLERGGSGANTFSAIWLVSFSGRQAWHGFITPGGKSL